MSNNEPFHFTPTPDESEISFETNRLIDENTRMASLLNFSDSTSHLKGNLKLTFSNESFAYCNCSKWKRFKTWIKNIFRKEKLRCCYTGGMRPFWYSQEFENRPTIKLLIKDD